jgi:hypothetical protein
MNGNIGFPGGVVSPNKKTHPKKIRNKVILNGIMGFTQKKPPINEVSPYGNYTTENFI